MHYVNGFLLVTAQDINDCVIIPCVNGGSCVHWSNTYSCRCPWVFTGKRCEAGKRQEKRKEKGQNHKLIHE